MHIVPFIDIVCQYTIKYINVSIIDSEISTNPKIGQVDSKVRPRELSAKSSTESLASENIDNNRFVLHL